ncbi:MAG: cytochrome c3 family protein [Acidobacteria bacterium]|nr:cytochrome c3 family protein [Acidobacteriota bacterium]MCW5971152.1 cytochrome c3 family protein [Blastocatellales bacterium]
MSLTKLVLTTVFVVAIVASILYARTRREPYAPVQPIDYSHRLHVTEKKIKCDFCHENGQGKTPYMLAPSAQKCALCHRAIKPDSPEVQKILQHAEAGTEPEWKRVTGISATGSVFFTHVPHLQAKIECSTCHGPIEEMDRVTRFVEPTMGWCLSCHEQTPNQIRKVPHTNVEVNRLTDCAVCHR